jgi:C4-dicarboxylate transporter DctQ subunit
MIYLCIPLGSYLMCFRFLQVMWRYLKTGTVPHQAHEYEASDEAPVAPAAPTAALPAAAPLEPAR